MSEQEATLDEYNDPEGTRREDENLLTGVAWSALDYVPEDWTINNIESDISITTGNNFSSDDFAEESGIPLIRIRDLGTGETTVNYTGEYEERYLVNDDDLLVGMDGEFEPHLWSGGEAVLNQRVCRIVPEQTYNKVFLRYAVEKPLWYIQKSIAGTTVKHLSQSNIRDINLPTPPLEEQRKIASVLYTVDQAIQKTEDIIKHARAVRAGIEQDVFTTGYYEHEETQEVRLGPVKTSIPTEWDLKTIPDRFEIIDGDRGKNYPNQSELFNDGFCLFLSANNVTEDGLEFNDTEFISQEKDDELRKGKLSRGDIVMTTRGTVGNFGYFEEDVSYDNMRINSGMVILRPTKKVTNPKYYYYLFQSGIFQKQINATSYGTAQPQTSVTELKKMGLIEPGEAEKEKIIDLIEDLNTMIYSNEEYRNQLQRLKQALMQDLLSGEVRTHDNRIEVVEEVLTHG